MLSSLQKVKEQDLRSAQIKKREEYSCLSHVEEIDQRFALLNVCVKLKTD